MKKTFAILASIFFTIAGLSSAACQWERIGWEGGQVFIYGQLGNALYDYSYTNTIYKSVDWGKTWIDIGRNLPKNTNLFSSAKIGVTDEMLLIDFSDSYNKTLDSSEFRIYYCKEADSQFSFKKISLIKGTAPSIIFWHADSMIAIRNKNYLTDTADGMYISIDTGTSWQFRSSLSINNYPIIEHSVLYRYLKRPMQLERSENFGISWQKINLPTGDTIQFNFGLFEDKGLMLQLFRPTDDTLPLFYFSSDRGVTWNIANVPIPHGTTITGSFFCSTLGNKLFFSVSATLGNLLFESKDQGKNWELKFKDSSFVIGRIYGKDDIYIVHHYLTDSTFKLLTPIFLKGIFAAEQYLSVVNNSKLIYLPNQQLSDSVLISTDNGSTWNTKEFYKGYRVYFLKNGINKKNIYAVGIQEDSSDTIFRSTDEGNTWNIVNILSSSKVAALDFFGEGDTMLIKRANDYVITIDNGKSWTVIQFPLPSSTINMDYREGVILLQYSDVVLASTDLGATWENQNVFFTFGPAIIDNRWFVASSNGKTYQTYFRTPQDKEWKVCQGLSPALLSIPSQEDKGIFLQPVLWVLMVLIQSFITQPIVG